MSYQTQMVYTLYQPQSFISCIPIFRATKYIPQPAIHSYSYFVRNLAMQLMLSLHISLMYLLRYLALVNVTT